MCFGLFIMFMAQINFAWPGSYFFQLFLSLRRPLIEATLRFSLFYFTRGTAEYKIDGNCVAIYNEYSTVRSSHELSRFIKF